MNLRSDYLNPFQPFPERELNSDGRECPRDAIEDNMSRAVFSVLGNAEGTCALAMFVQALAQRGSPVLRSLAEALATALRTTDANAVEVGLQTWPTAAVEERKGQNVLLIGISSSHCSAWTYDRRAAPSKEGRRADAWVYVPGRMLLVFECKNDEHPLDATQMSDYAHALRLLKEESGVPRAKPGLTLDSPEQAQAVQNACKDLVLDAPWDTVVAALQQIQRSECVGGLGRWLSGQAAAYICSHVLPPYEGIRTIREWLNGPDTEDRRPHLRTLVGKMGDALHESAQELPDAITFARGKTGSWDLSRGAGSALYVKLRQGERPLPNWLGENVNAVLWFRFTADENERIGLEYYVQAAGRCPGKSEDGDKIRAWNKASARHLTCARPFEELFAAWSGQALPGSLVAVSTVRFNGRKRNWQKGGVEDPEGPRLTQAAPQQALAFIQANRELLWRFPRVGPGEEVATVEEAASLVRKPACSLLARLDTNDLAACGTNARALQETLIQALKTITPGT